MAGIISSFEKFSELYNDKPFLEKDSNRLTALKEYFSFGGVISVRNTERGWPKLSYPSPLKLKSDLDELYKFRETFAGRQRGWKRELNEAKIYHTKHNILKLSNPIYWRHVAKCLREPEYKKAASDVKLPAHLVSDPRWQPMIKTFLTDPDYRANLTETVQSSVVYEKDKRVAKYADTLNKFRSDVSTKNLSVLQKKLAAIDKRISILKTIEKWARE